VSSRTVNVSESPGVQWPDQRLGDGEAGRHRDGAEGEHGGAVVTHGERPHRARLAEPALRTQPPPPARRPASSTDEHRDFLDTGDRDRAPVVHCSPSSVTVSDHWYVPAAA